MMRHSHRHARHLWRLLCPAAVLYTEMCPAASLARTVQHRHVHDRSQHPVILQLAGDDPAILAIAARRGADLGYAGLDLNCGCPSARAVAGGFGACMMAQPQRVADCVVAMRQASGLPVSVKCRLAINDHEPEACLDVFAQHMRAAGVAALTVHARKAWLGGLNPKQNRVRPPLCPDLVVDLKVRYPDLNVITNGGITTVAAATARARGVDGVMLGRAIVARPGLLAQFATDWFGQPPVELGDIVREYLGYCARQLLTGEHPRRLLVPLAGLVAGRTGARAFRRRLQEATTTGDLATVLATWP